MAGSGSSSGFNAADFRSAIHFAMTMGAAPHAGNQITFVTSETATYVPQDPNQNPYSWTETPATEVAAVTTVVPAAVVFGHNTGLDGTPVGEFDAGLGTLTLLDVDYVQVQNADQVIISGVHYVISPPGWTELGLFDVSVWQAQIRARG